MRAREWARATTQDEFPLPYRAQFHAESVLDCKETSSNLSGLTYVGRRGAYIFDFITPRDNHVTVTFLTERSKNRGKIKFVRIKTGTRVILVDVGPVTMVKPVKEGSEYREVSVDYYRVMDFYKEVSDKNPDATRIWNMHPFNLLEQWKRLAETSV